MSGIIIRAKSGEFTGELDEGSLPDAVWLSLPKTFYINIFLVYKTDVRKTAETTCKFAS